MTSRPKVLFVDDESAVLEGLKLTQSRHYDVLTARSGEAGLELLRRQPDIAVVVSDMRMPEMDGARFLSDVKEVAPDAVRLLLTGHADLEAAARAVNEGRVFRFLTKPCEPSAMASALSAAVDLHLTMMAERVLLQQTLVGAVKAVISVLGLNNPIAMGRADRVRNRSRKVLQNLGAQNPWNVEFAAMFSQLAAASLPESTTRKLYNGEHLSNQEQVQLTEDMQAINEILAEIPRLEPVTAILDELIELTRRHEAIPEKVTRKSTEARILHAIIDLESLESRGQSPRQALKSLLSEPQMYGEEALAALGNVIEQAVEPDVGCCTPEALADGMVLAEDLKTIDGLLLLPRGFELSRSSRQHIVTRFKDRLPKRIKVHMPADSRPATSQVGGS